MGNVFDEVSARLGRVEATCAIMVEQLEKHKDETSEQLKEIRTSVDAQTKMLQAEHAARQQEKLDKANSDVRMYRRVAALLLGSTVTGGAVGTSFGPGVKAMLVKLVGG